MVNQIEETTGSKENIRQQENIQIEKGVEQMENVSDFVNAEQDTIDTQEADAEDKYRWAWKRINTETKK